jgi:tRNA-dihydrouridine synthase
VLTIGSVPIEHPFAQAALSGYSDPPMRRVARMHGASYTVNEVVLDRSVMHESDWQRQLLSLEPDAHPVGGQLMGSDPASFAPAARLLADAGYDVIDINFGCPAPKVLDRCRGGFLLSDPETALEIIGRVVDAVGDDRPVTVKMRRGHDDSAESERNFFTILDGAFDLGIAAVTVHGRTVRQRYTGASNRAFLARVKRHLGDKMMLGSGDLFTAQDCIDLPSARRRRDADNADPRQATPHHRHPPGRSHRALRRSLGRQDHVPLRRQIRQTPPRAAQGPRSLRRRTLDRRLS